MSEVIKKLVLEKRKEGKIVVSTLDGFMSLKVKGFIEQPIEGILYDLNRLEEVVLTFIDDPKWVNDFAVALTIRALKDRIAQLDTELKGCRKLAKSYIDEYEKLVFEGVDEKDDTNE